MLALSSLVLAVVVTVLAVLLDVPMRLLANSDGLIGNDVRIKARPARPAISHAPMPCLNALKNLIASIPWHLIGSSSVALLRLQEYPAEL